MAITADQISHVAKLARLQITKQEMDGYYAQVPRIVEYVSKLQIIEGSNATSPATASRGNGARDDEIACPQGTGARDRLLACSPNRAGDYIAIPAIFS